MVGTIVSGNPVCSERRALPQQILNYLLITTCVLVLVLTANSPAAGESPTVSGKVVQQISSGSSENPPENYLVRYAALGAKREVITCSATNVTSITWVQGSSVTDKNNVEILRCAETKDSQNKSGDPCTRGNVTEEGKPTESGWDGVGEVQLNLTFESVKLKDLGPYTCITVPLNALNDSEPLGTTVHLQADFSITRLTPMNKTFEKGYRSVVVSAGEKLSIYCNLTGADIDDVEITWSKDGEALPFLEDDNFVNYTDLWFDYREAEEKHRGRYRCSAKLKDENETTKFFEYKVRVYAKLAPLWPFLSICVAVAVLFITIFCYEKRRDKTELEERESDSESAD